MRKIVLTEEEECYLLVEWLDLLIEQGKVVLYTHIPNETFTKSWTVKVKNKKMGVKKGFPDYIIVGKNKAICLEMKREQGGKTSPEQVLWIYHLTASGIPSFVAKGFNSAVEIVSRELL